MPAAFAMKQSSAHSPCSLRVLKTVLPESPLFLSNKKRGHEGRAAFQFVIPRAVRPEESAFDLELCPYFQTSKLRG